MYHPWKPLKNYLPLVITLYIPTFIWENCPRHHWWLSSVSFGLREAEADVFYSGGFLNIATSKNEVQGQTWMRQRDKHVCLLRAGRMKSMTVSMLVKCGYVTHPAASVCTGYGPWAWRLNSSLLWRGFWLVDWSLNTTIRCRISDHFPSALMFGPDPFMSLKLQHAEPELFVASATSVLEGTRSPRCNERFDSSIHFLKKLVLIHEILAGLKLRHPQPA